jgi:hypothetical protein
LRLQDKQKEYKKEKINKERKGALSLQTETQVSVSQKNKPGGLAFTLLRAALPMMLTSVHTVSMWKSSLPGAGAGGSLLAHHIMRSVAKMCPLRRTNSSCERKALPDYLPDKFVPEHSWLFTCK